MSSAAEPRSAAWSWRKEHFEETFGRRSPGRLRENWPAGTRIAVLLTFDTQGDVDAAVPDYQTCVWHNGAVNYCDVTMRQYDIVEGVPRILRILDEFDVKATFPICGATARWYPETVAEIHGRGHEVASHGFRHVPLVDLAAEAEQEEIERTTVAIRDVTGERPRGWRSPMYSTTERTLDLLRDDGYTWNSDFHDADFPYVLTKDGRPIVEIPAGQDDWSMYLQVGGGAEVQMGGTPYGNADGVLSTLRAEFDMLYRESADDVRVFQWCMHPKITGRAFRAAVLLNLIEYIKSHDGVWFATCSEIADLA